MIGAFCLTVNLAMNIRRQWQTRRVWRVNQSALKFRSCVRLDRENVFLSFWIFFYFVFLNAIRTGKTEVSWYWLCPSSNFIIKQILMKCDMRRPKSLFWTKTALKLRSCVRCDLGNSISVWRFERRVSTILPRMFFVVWWQYIYRTSDKTNEVIILLFCVDVEDTAIVARYDSSYFTRIGSNDKACCRNDGRYAYVSFWRLMMNSRRILLVLV